MLVAVLAVSCSKGSSGGGSLSTADQVAMATKLAGEACVGAPAVNGDGSATCDTTTLISVWGTASERDTELAKTKAVTPGGAWIKAATWYIGCDPANAARITAATGGAAG